MEIILNDKNGVVLHTSKKYCQEDIKVKIDDNIILDTTDATATATDIMLNKTAYVNGEKITGTANPIETTITPSATQQIKSGLFNKVTVTGDSNLIAENIKEGVNIFGVNGVLTTEVVTKPYIELEYIESTGTQYIDTEYQPTYSTAYEFEVSKMSEPYDAPIFSASSVWSFDSCIFTALQQKYNWWYYSGDAIRFGDISTGDRVDKIYLYAGYVKLNDVVINSDTTVNSNLRADRTLRIFSGPVTGPDGHYTKFRLHSFKIMSSSPDEEPIYIRDFVPAKWRSTGEIGLYDKAEGKFYANQGTGVFTAGAEILEDTELTITPKTEEQVKEGVFTKITVLGDEDLIADNIKKDVEIFGVTGTYEGVGGGENNYNATMVGTSSSTESTTFILTKTITHINVLDVSGIKNMSNAFSSCPKLTKVEGFLNTGSITNVIEMFRNCSKLEYAPSIKLNETTISYAMFRDCSALKKVGNIETPISNTMHTMFYGCSSLETVDGLNTSKATYTYQMFYNCYSLKSVPQLQMGEATMIDEMFYNCSALTDLGGFIDLGKAYTTKSSNNWSYGLRLNNSYKLTHDSLMNVINGLYDLNLSYDVANGGTLYTQQLIINSSNKAKLTVEEIAIATSKRMDSVIRRRRKYEIF